MTIQRTLRTAAILMAVGSLLAAGAARAGDGCSRGPALDWETMPEGGFAYHGINCYVETLLQGIIPVFYSDDATGLEMVAYGFSLNTAGIYLPTNTVLRVLELLPSKDDSQGEGKPLIWIGVFQESSNERALCVEWQDNIGHVTKHCSQDPYLKATSLIEVQWRVDTGEGNGNIEVMLDGAVVVSAAVDNSQRVMGEVHIGHVSPTLMPPSAFGVLRYRPEYKLFDFAPEQI